VATRKTEIASRLIARLSPDSPDPDARADANNAPLMAELAASRRRAKEVGGAITAEELDRRRPLSLEEIAEADAWLDELEHKEAAAAREVGRGQPRGRPPSEPNGKVLLRLPLSIHRELIARAASERTSLNQLVLAYIRRGLGQDEGGAAH
jgi:predicted HicB family RNase H-like nuclease